MPTSFYRGPASFTSQSIASLPYLRQYVAGRKTSYDRTGGNSDWVRIPARSETKIVELEGPGVITHIWIPFGPDPFKRIVLKMYWDGEQDPSVEVPLPDFFGSSVGELTSYSSAMTSSAPVDGYNCYFPMPFAKSAGIAISLERDEPIERLYFAVDYLALPNPLNEVGSFHAQYRQSGNPKLPVALHAGSPLEHEMIQARGRGHLVGYAYSLIATVSGAWASLRESLRLNLDGDKNILLDDGARPYDSADHLNAHCFSWSGRPYAKVGDFFMGRFSRYRWFLDGPPTFQQELELDLAVKCELGSNLVAHSVGYWYQVEPHQKFPSLPAAENRVPRL
jgi:Protein of unknown function (DUF2961)